MSYQILTGVHEEIDSERKRQDAKWGEQNHDPFTWLAILGEEVGEANKAAVDSCYWNRPEKFAKFNLKALADYRTELIQVAAVAVSMIECLDRDKWLNVKEAKPK